MPRNAEAAMLNLQRIQDAFGDDADRVASVCSFVSCQVVVKNYAFAVKDDGPGIPPEFHDQVFKMFQTLKPRDQVEGSGMGLATVRKNVEIFGGTLTLESAEGRGCVFRFTWPKRQVQKIVDREVFSHA